MLQHNLNSVVKISNHLDGSHPYARVHGGSLPATSDVRGTSIGTGAIDRFLRPVCYQNTPQALLPLALQDDNPLGIKRLVNGVLS